MDETNVVVSRACRGRAAGRARRLALVAAAVMIAPAAGAGVAAAQPAVGGAAQPADGGAVPTVAPPRASRPRSGRRFSGASLAALLTGGRPGRVDLTVGVGVDLAYDSNVYNGRGQDLVVRVSPRLALLWRERWQQLRVAYELGWWTYARHKAEASLNHRGTIGWDVNVTRRLALHLGDEIVRAEDPGFLLRTGVIAPQTGITDNAVDLLAAYRAERRVTLEAGYGYRLTRFDAPPPGSGPLHDADEHDAVAAVRVAATRLDDLRLSYRFQDFIADGDPLARAHSPALAWRHRFARDLDVTAEAGPLAYVGARAGEPDGWTWRGAAVVRWDARPLRVTLSYVHDMVGGTGAATVLWYDGAYARAAWRLGDWLTVAGGVGMFANGPAPTGERIYDGVTLDAGIDVRIIDNLRAAAWYMFRWQEADVAPFASITRHIVSLRLVAVFGAEARPAQRVHP